MCIIVAKRKGAKLPYRYQLELCYDNNYDGAGIAWVDKKGYVNIHKGLMTEEEFFDAYDNLEFTEDDTFLLHFRIGTSGFKKGDVCTHPFPIVKDGKRLFDLKTRCRMAFAHNGVLSTGDGEYSDSQVFVRDVLSNDLIKQYFLRGCVDVIDTMFQYICKDNRMAFISADGIRLVGDWVFDKKTGVWYSNGSYAYSKYSYQYKKDDKDTTTATTSTGSTATGWRGHYYDDDEWVGRTFVGYCPECLEPVYISDINTTEFKRYWCDSCEQYVWDDEMLTYQRMMAYKNIRKTRDNGEGLVDSGGNKGKNDNDGEKKQTSIVVYEKGERREIPLNELNFKVGDGTDVSELKNGGLVDDVDEDTTWMEG